MYGLLWTRRAPKRAPHSSPRAPRSIHRIIQSAGWLFCRASFAANLSSPGRGCLVPVLPLLQCTFSRGPTLLTSFFLGCDAASASRTARRRFHLPPSSGRSLGPCSLLPREPGPVPGPAAASEVSPPRCLSGEQLAFTRIRALCRVATTPMQETQRGPTTPDSSGPL